MPVLAQKSLATQKVKAYLKLAQESEGIWASIIIFFGALFLLGAIPFYPIYLIPVLAAICGAIAYKHPAFGMLLSFLLAFPAISYQSAIFGWVFALVIALVLFEMFENWLIIAYLEIVVMAPFSFGHLPFFGWFSILGMALGALRFGSRKSVIISIPAVFAILLLSSLWGVQNSAFLPLNLDKYKPLNTDLIFSKGIVDIVDLPAKLASSLGGLFDFSTFGRLNEALSQVIGNTIVLLFSDSGLIQLVAWALVLYAMAYVSGQSKSRHYELFSSLILFLVVPVYFLIAQMMKTEFHPEIIFVLCVTSVAIAILESYGVKISHEADTRRAENVKSFGKFGLQDMGVGGDEKSMNDVGGYEDVKTELRDSILLPLENKELSYAYGIKPPAGILLFGPPGTGKTMLMRALAKELKYGFYYIKSSDILSQWYGESLPYDEKILIQKNGKVSLEEIGMVVEEKQGGKVLCFDNYGKIGFSDITGHIKHKCTSPILEVRTKTGRTIRVTDYHSLFTLNGAKVESVETSKLVPGVSYVAIPSRIPFSNKKVDHIDFLEALRNNDYRLRVKNVSVFIEQAILEVGKKEVCNLFNIKPWQLHKLIKNNGGFSAGKFLRLMDLAKINFDKSKIVIYSRANTIPAVVKIDADFSTFLGLWVAEGSYNRDYVVRISTSLKESEQIISLCKKLFGKVSPYRKKINGKEGLGVDLYIIGKPLFVLLHHVLGLNHGADLKNVPAIAFNLSKENLAAFLRGYISGDGNLHQNQRKVMRIEVSTVSKELANSILYLLLHFGIVAKLESKKEWTGNYSNRISLLGSRNVQKFTQIGFLSPDKQSKISAYLNNINWSRAEQIPITGELRTIVDQHFPKYANSNNISRDLFGSLDEVEDIVESDIYFDRVEEIKKVGDEAFVYDISVDPTQNFVGGIGGIFVHNSEKNISEIFSIARSKSPAILFFDEIDSIGKKRTSYSADDVGPRVLSVLLQEMDGLKSGKSIIVIGATNVPHQLDPALLRPGRIDKIIYMNLPDQEARKAIFETHCRKVPVSEDVDFDKLATKTDRFSGADLKNIVQEAIKIAAREAGLKGVVVPVTMQHFLTVLKTIKPSTGIAQLEDYERFQLDFERRVGAKEEVKVKEDVITWKDVAGLDDVRESLLETIELPLKHEKEMKEFKIKPTKGILLFGPPGTGKTLIVKAASNELKASFQSMSGAELLKQGYAPAVGTIKDVFNRARENTPAIIFVDEVETLTAAAARSISGEILGQFLVEMDGIKELKGVVVMAATNKPNLLDPAVLRPGRFDKIFYVPPPDEKGRADIFRIHLGEFAEGVDVAELAKRSDGFTGADIAGICQEVKMKALRSKVKGESSKITADDLLKVISRRKPSVTKEMLREFEMFLDAYGERR